MDPSKIIELLSASGGWGVAALFYWQWHQSEKRSREREMRIARMTEQHIETMTRNDVIMERLIRLLERLQQ